MLSRRQLVKRSLAVAASTLGTVVTFGAADPAEFVPKHLLVTPATRDLLEEESRAGFQSVMPAGSIVTDLIPQNSGEGRVIVLPSVQNLPRESINALLNSMQRGAWVILERAADFGPETTDDARELFADALGIRVRRYTDTRSRIFVQYHWPTFALVRAFHRVALLNCPTSDVIAEYDGGPVAVRRACGNGGLVFLGSMLGPGIRAGETQARQIAQALLDPAD